MAQADLWCVQPDALQRCHRFDNVLSRTDFNGDTTTFEYNSIDLVTRKLFEDGSEVLYTYTPIGMPETITDSRGDDTPYVRCQGSLD